ncbi:MAG: hypothetical protein KUG77_04750 [Nannocystaceae bacterium]|nr:hypothetical protein [Nannocystaceae bacterium]
MTISNEMSNLPSKTLLLSAVTDGTGSYPQLVYGDAVIDTTTAVELVSDAARGQAMRGVTNISWDDSIEIVAVEGWTVDPKSKTATGSYIASTDVMQKDTAFTVQCVLKDGGKPATDAPSGWVGPDAKGVWTLDPYVRLRRKGFKVTQVV